MYLTYEEYKAYGGEIPQIAFVKYERQARNTINYYTFGRIKEPVSETVKECMVELMDFEYEVDKARDEGSKAIKSETVGDHTVSYADGLDSLGIKTGANTGTSQASLEYSIVAKYIMSTGLMYRGVE